MSRATITIDGFVSNDPKLEETRTGKQVVKITVPHTPRKLNEQTREWEDAGETTWYDATFWDDHATVVYDTLRKGDAVILTGGLKVSAWESSGKLGVNVEVVFPTIAKVARKPKRGQAPPADSWSAPPETTDAWAPAPETGSEVPF